MNKIFLFMVMLFFSILAFSQGNSDPKRGNGKTMELKRFSLCIPTTWLYVVEKQNEEEFINLYSDNESISQIEIIVTKDRPERDFAAEIVFSGKQLLSDVLSDPQFKGCNGGGSGSYQKMWGRDGTVAKFLIYRDKEQKDLALVIYRFGQKLPDTEEVLFINVFSSVLQNKDIDDIISSINVKTSNNQ